MDVSSFSPAATQRSEVHTSELQSQFHLVCRLLLEKKKKKCVIGPPFRFKQTQGTKLAARKRQFPNPLTGGGKDGVREGGHERRHAWFFFLSRRRPPISTLFPYTTLCR